MTRRFLVVSNASSGSMDDGLEDELLRSLPNAELLRIDEDVDLGKAVGGAVAEERIVVAAGGDGTINAVVQHLGEGTLGVVPGGTRNHFARDLGLSDPKAALEALKGGTTRRIDLGRVNGKAFVNNAGIGLYPELVEERERREDAIGKWPATFAAALRLWRNADPLVGRASCDGDERMLHAWLVFVGNNRFRATPRRLGARDRLDEGVLEVRVVTARRHPHSYTPALRLLRSSQWQPGGQVRATARRLDIALSGHARPFSLDGETAGPERKLRFEIEPGALTVLAPD